jgi:hypothetical protein
MSEVASRQKQQEQSCKLVVSNAPQELIGVCQCQQCWQQACIAGVQQEDLTEAKINEMLRYAWKTTASRVWWPVLILPLKDLYLINTRPCVVICHYFHCCPVFTDWLVSLCMV